MRLSLKRTLTVLAAVFAAAGTLMAQDGDNSALQGRIVAVGIPGASTITPVGLFTTSSPIGNPNNALNAFTQTGRVLDRTRILVGSTSNFGAPLGNPNEAEGTILSIDPTGDTLVIDPNFATAGGQVSSFGGRVQVYTANSAAFLNSVKNQTANTANVPGTSNPLGISLNWAFGRLWPANAPNGLENPGTSSILDPQGFGLAGAPNHLIGGEYQGTLTNRSVVTSLPQAIPGGLNTGAVGTALLGPSPDNTTPVRAVFAVVEADGSIVQENTAKGLDGLASQGTISPLLGHRDKLDGNGNPGVSPRLGVVFRWERTLGGLDLPAEILYVSEPFENSIAALVLDNDGNVFTPGTLTHFSSDALNEPIDLTPVNMEATDVHFASNTTLDGDSDFYVANRGNNTIVRMTQTGQVVSVRQVTRADGMPFGDARLNGIATSQDGLKIWVTVTGHMPGIPNSTGAVLEMNAF